MGSQLVAHLEENFYTKVLLRGWSSTCESDISTCPVRFVVALYFKRRVFYPILIFKKPPSRKSLNGPYTDRVQVKIPLAGTMSRLPYTLPTYRFHLYWYNVSRSSYINWGLCALPIAPFPKPRSTGHKFKMCFQVQQKPRLSVNIRPRTTCLPGCSTKKDKVPNQLGRSETILSFSPIMEHKLSHFLPSGTNNPFHPCQENGRCSLKCRLNKDTIQNKSYHYHTNNPFIHSFHNFSNVQPTAVLGLHASPSVCSQVPSTRTIGSVTMCHQALFGRVSTQQPC